MGNGCCFGDAGGTMAVGSSSVGGYHKHHNDGPNDAVSLFLKYRGYHGLFSQIELSLSASTLRDRDVLSKSDPIAVIYMKGRDGRLEELGRTEIIMNSLNPAWIKKINVIYHFELVQTLVFRVYDVDTQFLHAEDVKMIKLDDQQFLGEASCALSEIITRSNRSLTLDLAQPGEIVKSVHPSSSGKLTVNAEESISSKTTTELIFRCSELENKDLFSKSDPFLVISKLAESGTTIPICKTEVVKDDLDPTWKPVFLNIQQIGSKDSPLIIECLNFNSNGKHDLIGKIEKSLAEMEKIYSSRNGANLYLPDAIGHDNHNKVLKSQLFVDKFSESIQYTFLDYMAGGCELNFMVAIDFTVHNNWYQSRSIRFARRYAEDRDIHNPHSDGAIESMNNNIRGPRITGMQECQKADIRKSLNRMEKLLEHMLNILDKQSQNLSKQSKQYQADLEQCRSKNMEQQTNLKAAHHKKDTVDLGNRDEVVEKEAKRTDSEDTEAGEMETAKKDEGLTKQNDEIGKSVTEADLGFSKAQNKEEDVGAMSTALVVEDLENNGEVIEKEAEHEDLTKIQVAECTIVYQTVVDTVDHMVNLEGGENKSSVGKFNNRYDFMHGVRRSAGKAKDVYLGFWKKRKQRRGRVRRRKQRSTKKAPVSFPVEQFICGGYGGAMAMANQAATSSINVRVRIWNCGFCESGFRSRSKRWWRWRRRRRRRRRPRRYMRC